MMDGVATAMGLQPDDLNPTDEAILDELQDGRVSAGLVAARHNYTGGNVRNRLTNLVKHGHVRQLEGAVYELIDDPREGDQSDGGADT
jgi:hypothetical protein